VLAITTEADNQYIDAIIREVYHEIDRLHNDLAPLEELEMVRSYMLGDFCRAYEGPFSLSEAWIYTETAELDDEFFERQVDSIRSVTSEEIRTLAQRYLCKEKLIDVVAGKKV
jgi:predicted Zn-dependent peptidase